MGLVLSPALVLLLLAAPAWSDPWADLRGADDAAARAAFAQLSAGDAATRQRLADDLLTLQRQAGIEATRAAHAANALLGFTQPGRRDADLAEWRQRHAAWRTATERLQAFVFDPAGVYHVPGGDATHWRPGVDVQPGQEQVEALTQAAVSAWNQLNAFVVAQAVQEGWLANGPQGSRPAETAPASRPGEVAVYAIGDPRPWVAALLGAPSGEEGALPRALRELSAAEQRGRRYADFRRALGQGGDAPAPPAVRPLISALQAALAADARPPVASAPGLAPAEAEVVAVIVRAARASREPPAHTGGLVRAVWRSLQAYRLAAGAEPLAWHDALARAAADHADDMQRLSFFAHQSPVSGKGTLAERAGAVGFRGPVGECLDRGPLEPGGQNAVWRWRADAEHHRLVLSPAYSSGAVGAAGRVCVLVVGTPADAAQKR